MSRPTVVSRSLLLAIAAVAIAFAVYYDSFNNGFVWDDYCFVVNNASLRSPDASTIGSYFTDRDTASSNPRLSGDVYRPLVTLSFAADYALWRLNPHPYHIVNTAVHLANTLLVFIIVELLVGTPVAAFFAASVFALHPVQTEAVTWISGRSNVLFLFFYLGSLLAHIRLSRETGPARDARSPLIFYCLALFSKEMAITLPLILLLYDLSFSRPKPFRARLRYYTPFALLTVAYLVIRLTVVGSLQQGAGYWEETFLGNLRVTITSVAAYLRLLLMPVNLRADYNVEIPSGIAPFIAAALAAIALGGWLWAARRDPALRFFVLWFFVTLLPVLHIVPFRAIIAERLLYLPLIGFAAMLATFLEKTRSRTPPFVTILIMAGFLVSYGAATFARNRDWRNEITLYTVDLARTPQSARFHYNLGLAYGRMIALETAKGVKREALLPYCRKAKEEFEEAVRLDSPNVDLYVNLGNVCDILGETERAVWAYKMAIARGESPAAYNNLGFIYFKEKRYADAIKCYRRALSLPWANRAVGFANIGKAYEANGEPAKARRAFENARALDPEAASLLQRFDGKGKE